MNQQKCIIVNIDNLREKLGLSQKKCIYKIENGEIIIYHINENEECA